MPRDFIYRGCKEAERAFKRSQFDPSKQKPEEFPWFIIKPGEEFHIPLDKMNHIQAKAAAAYRSKKSGYVYRVSKRIDGTLVHRTA